VGLCCCLDMKAGSDSCTHWIIQGAIFSGLQLQGRDPIEKRCLLFRYLLNVKQKWWSRGKEGGANPLQLTARYNR
jgi:hypothetical protein